MNDALKRLEEWRLSNPEHSFDINSPYDDIRQFECCLYDWKRDFARMSFGDTLEAAINSALEAWEKQ